MGRRRGALLVARLLAQRAPTQALTAQPQRRGGCRAFSTGGPAPGAAAPVSSAPTAAPQPGARKRVGRNNWKLHPAVPVDVRLLAAASGGYVAYKAYAALSAPPRRVLRSPVRAADRDYRDCERRVVHRAGGLRPARASAGGWAGARAAS